MVYKANKANRVKTIFGEKVNRVSKANLVLQGITCRDVQLLTRTGTTGAAGTDAEVVNSGNTTNAVADTIPRWMPGNQGLIGDTPPPNPNVGDWWFDTKCPSQQYVWDGTQWVGTSTPGPRGADGRTASVGDTPPANPVTGNLWFDTNDCPQGLYAWDGDFWVDVTKWLVLRVHLVRMVLTVQV